MIAPSAGQGLLGINSVGASGAALPHPSTSISTGQTFDREVLDRPSTTTTTSTTGTATPAMATSPVQVQMPIAKATTVTGALPATMQPPSGLLPSVTPTGPTSLDFNGNTASSGVPPYFTSPSGTQSAPAIGAPTGYNLGQGIDTSVQSFMPSGVDASTFQNIPLQETKPPDEQSYIQSAQSQTQGPTQWTVTPNQTVAGQYASLMSKGDPAIQAAEESTLRANAASGGRNSLMAQNAATLAGSQVALSIAQQDAQTNAQAGEYNANAANTFAQQMNSFVESMTASQQSFDAGYAQLKNQFSANMGSIYAQVLQGAAAASENVKQTIDATTVSTNATLEQMDKTFSQNVAETEMQNQFSNENAWTNYGLQVRASYLASINQQQTALMQTIAAINSNPNINSTQAAAGIQSAVSQFNSFMSMNNAYYAAMVPSNNTATYQAYDPDGWPNN